MSEEPREIEVETQPRVVAPEQRPPATPRLSAWWLVVAVGAVALVVLALGQLRWAVILVASGLWLGAGIRAVVPETVAGGLVVRSRGFDVLVLVALGAAVLVVGLALRRT